MREPRGLRFRQCRFSSSGQLPDVRFERFEWGLFDETRLRHKACFRIQDRYTRYIGDRIVAHDVVLALIQSDHIKCSVLPVSEKNDHLISRLESRHTRNPYGFSTDRSAKLTNENSAPPLSLNGVVYRDGDVCINHFLFVAGFNSFHMALHNAVGG